MKKGNFQRLLAGPPETHRLKSGYVTLKKGEEVGAHSTIGKEEVIVVLGGKGKAVFKKLPSRIIEKDSLLYIPPDTEHNIKNIGSHPLRYVYVTAFI